MRLEGGVALVTGANRGLGAAFARALVERGAKTVYAGVRDPASVRDPRLVPVRLDVTDPAQVAAAAERCGDVDLLINNAGVLGEAEREMATNYHGTLAMSRAFAPVLARNGGGVLVNMLSVLSFITFPQVATYAASKAAAWSLTNALRQELREQGTLVVGVHAGYIDTEMAARVTAPKVSPELVAAMTLDGVAAGLTEVLVDELSRGAKAGLSAVPA
ncbi:SDR family oxidoreductase [Nonomuraea africana]|uniref:NAD(P)-dependent dehydrogenase (Short-subunit alcohol dehydrogenase family) n=1 Tax=Nonomuraea africana TaxID=46171 RepID=A0ABR9KA53_9ACTN|nr:SDR family oxidoreductase [Nonomuraea africana]MBE1558888.1 NAD(P)-dependent dehydrogenase (short-subunit alcohol dehydrogenase family) [Nonomuraea africana]